MSAQQIQSHRSKSAIYHLFTGKRSIQTVQDAHLFGIDRFYGVLPTLSRQTFDQHILQCIEKGLLEEYQKDDSSYVVLSRKGEQFLKQATEPINYFNGLRFYKRDESFYKKLLLLTQVLTNHYQNYTSYIPIIDDQKVLHWMKKVYPSLKDHLKENLYVLYEDLYKLLKHFSNREAEIFVSRLTSYKRYGLSVQQLSQIYNYSKFHIRLLLRAIVQQMLQLIVENKVSTKLLGHIVEGLPAYSMLTKSAQQTYNLLNKGYTAKQISSIRRLKLNTIYDHIVEICWYDQSFPVEQYITKQQIKEVKEALLKAKSLKLKLIKHFAPEQLTYFQIRLALTRIKNIASEGGFSNVSEDRS